MARVQIKDRSCPNKGCRLFGQAGKGNIVLHGFVKLKHGPPRAHIKNTTLSERIASEQAIDATSLLDIIVPA